MLCPAPSFPTVRTFLSNQSATSTHLSLSALKPLLNRQNVTHICFTNLRKLNFDPFAAPPMTSDGPGRKILGLKASISLSPLDLLHRDIRKWKKTLQVKHLAFC